MNYTKFSQFFHSRTKIIFCNITNHVHPLVDSFIYRHVLSKRKNFYVKTYVMFTKRGRGVNLNFKKMMQIFHMEFEIQIQTKPTPSIVLNFFLETHRSRSFTHFNIHETIEPRFPAPSETIFWLLNWP